MNPFVGLALITVVPLIVGKFITSKLNNKYLYPDAFADWVIGFITLIILFVILFVVAFTIKSAYNFTYVIIP